MDGLDRDHLSDDGFIFGGCLCSNLEKGDFICSYFYDS